MSRTLTTSILAAVVFCAVTVASLTPGLARAATGTGTARATGKVTVVGGYYLTVQRPGRATGVIAAMTAAASTITGEDYPYVWGGGHGQAGVASIGEKGGSGYNGRRKGFDCSGSVAAVLLAGGLWPQGAGVPSDAGVIADLRAEHLIARGAGTGPAEVTLYDDPGVHIFMNIDGRFFGTSDGGGGGDAKGGPGWLDDGAWDVGSPHFKRWHIVPSALRQQTTAGLMMTFALGANPSLFEDLKLGDNVTVSYQTSKLGTMVAESVKLAGETALTGTVGQIDADGNFTVTTSGGQTYTLVPVSASLLYGLEAGDGVSIAYTDHDGTYTARTLTITSQPTPPPSPGPNYSTSPTSGGSGIAPTAPSGGSGL